jgi:hypothetical protein
MNLKQHLELILEEVEPWFEAKMRDKPFDSSIIDRMIKAIDDKEITIPQALAVALALGFWKGNQ